MKEIELETMSFIFETKEGECREIPFYELSIMEWIIYEDDKPKYYLNFDRRLDPIILQLTSEINKGLDEDKIIKDIGASINKKWTIHNNITVREKPNTMKPEKIKLFLLRDINEIK